MAPETLQAILDRLTAEEERRKARNQLSFYRPYAKQKEFHANGLTARERLLMAGNQLGKTFCGAAEMAYHLTGLYPDWWEGRRFESGIDAWAGSDTGETTRDNVQNRLVGPPSEPDKWGTGAIPGDLIVDTYRRQGLANALDTIVVKHASGDTSRLGFKSYDQGRQKWQGPSKHAVWFDEEPPMDVYMEGLTRTNATGGLVYLTFTPLLGMSQVVGMFLAEGDTTEASAGGAGMTLGAGKTAPGG